MNEIRTEGFTAKDMFNSATAKPLKTVVGQTLPIVGIWITERPDENGEVKEVVSFKTKTGEIYGSISSTVIRSAEALPEMFEEQEVIDINVEERPGSKGRNYLVITLA